MKKYAVLEVAVKELYVKLVGASSGTPTSPLEPPPSSQEKYQARLDEIQREKEAIPNDAGYFTKLLKLEHEEEDLLKLMNND